MNILFGSTQHPELSMKHVTTVLPRLIALLVVCAMILVSPPSRAQAPSETEHDRAIELFSKGVSAMKKRDFENARRILIEAFALMPAFDIAGTLGQVELELGLHRDAAEHLNYSLMHFPPSVSRKLKQTVEDGFDQAKQQVSTLRVEVTPPGAEVFVDGEPKGRADSLPREVFVLPGEHEVSASFGEQAVKRVVIAQAAREYAVALDVPAPEPTEKGVASSAPESSHQPIIEPTSDDLDQPSSQNWTPVWIAGGVGVLGLATGITFLATSSSKASDRDAGVNQMPGSGACAEGTPEVAADCGKSTDLDDAAATHRALAWTGFGVALAGGVAAALLWPGSKDNSEIAWHLAPLTPEGQPGVTAGVSGAF